MKLLLPRRPRSARRHPRARVLLLLLAVTVAATLVLAGGCRPKWKLVRVPGGDEEPYLASFIVQGVSEFEGALVAFSFNLNALYVGREAEFHVINKWGKLKAGSHRDEVKILAPGGVAPLMEDGAVFEVPAYDRNVINIFSFKGTFREVGTYWIQVYLNGALVERYPFRVIPEAPPPGSGG